MRLLLLLSAFFSVASCTQTVATHVSDNASYSDLTYVRSGGYYPSPNKEYRPR